uniref:BPTI/Kunitz inhibitor domain-containing protein n=1 Tax=Onchocerca volvulus TaxID=6282 RepID=A0A2K6VL40_ONCVO
MIRLFSFLLILIWATGRNCIPSDCNTIKDGGYRCENGTKPIIAFYFDNETEQCLPFRYEGCGGNENRFSTIKACRKDCIPEDYGSCALKAKAYGDNESNTVICSGPVVHSCPEKYTCKHLAFFGICCPKKTEEMFAKNSSPSCMKGELVKFDSGSFNYTLLGKSCSDRFCPENSKCFQQEIFAYCCQ